MSFQDHLLLWNFAALRVLDVRHAVIQPGDRLLDYRLPANAFLFSSRGKARLLLDELDYSADKCFVCHAGKGTFLDIDQVIEAFEYYMVFYKAVLPLPCRQELLRLHMEIKPFQAQYGMTPLYPLPLLGMIERMERLWLQDDQLQKFHVKAIFHQFVYELLEQLHKQGGETAQPDVVAQTVRYMEQNFAEPLTLSGLASVFSCNERQLQRLFKARLQAGPMEYLLQLRMKKAQGMLRNTDVAIQQIAESVGYADSYYFSRIFKKHVGMSPLHYKEQAKQRGERRLNPSRLSRSPIVPETERLYSLVDDENHYQYRADGGVNPMYTFTRALPAVSLMLALMLLLAACGVSGSSTSASGGNPKSGAPTTTATKDAVKAGPVTIKHVKGEVKLEQPPKKIAVLDTQYVDQLLALNEMPAGSVITTGDKTQFPPYLNDKVKDVKVLGTKDEPNLEAVIAMAPDFIVCTEFQEKIYDSLAKIAPTIMIDRNEDWRDTLMTFGKIVGKEKEAEKAVNDYKEKVNKLKAELASKMGGQTVAMIRPRDNSIRIHTTAHRTASILYTDLGLTPPKSFVNDKDTSAMVSLESLATVNPDHMFLLTDDQFIGLTQQFQATDTWKSLKSVKENHVYNANTSLWIAYYGPIAMNLVVDEIGKALLQK